MRTLTMMTRKSTVMILLSNTRPGRTLSKASACIAWARSTTPQNIATRSQLARKTTNGANLARASAGRRLEFTKPCAFPNVKERHIRSRTRSGIGSLSLGRLRVCAKDPRMGPACAEWDSGPRTGEK